jgi:hypothetical protein
MPTSRECARRRFLRRQTLTNERMPGRYCVSNMQILFPHSLSPPPPAASQDALLLRCCRRPAMHHLGIANGLMQHYSGISCLTRRLMRLLPRLPLLLSPSALSADRSA